MGSGPKQLEAYLEIVINLYQFWAVDIKRFRSYRSSSIFKNIKKLLRNFEYSKSQAAKNFSALHLGIQRKRAVFLKTKMPHTHTHTHLITSQGQNCMESKLSDMPRGHVWPPSIEGYCHLYLHLQIRVP